ncbi:transcriptional regulator NrdR [bacterium (candidate division B38) B3_B38]|nr:MAG: transcriptional regulator NrdR [bacterium (candidate division B38) B3_B38]
MKCPYCGHNKDKVIDSREKRGGEAIRRRRKCLACSRRFTTYERTEEAPYMVIKKDGRREPFDRQKILRGLLKACEKRPISVTTLEELTDTIEQKLLERSEREIPTSEVGSFIMEKLKELDKVAYVRFASVYREFKDINEFMDELKALLEK